MSLKKSTDISRPAKFIKKGGSYEISNVFVSYRSNLFRSCSL